MAAGLATLEMIDAEEFYTELSAMTRKLVKGLLDLAKEADVSLQAHCIGGLFGLFFTKETEIYHYAQLAQCNLLLFKRFFHEMLIEGIYFAPSPFESGFVSSAHTEEAIELTLKAARKVFGKLKEAQRLLSATAA